MRYYRFTANPQDSIVVNGVVTQRLRFALTNEMIYSTFVDGALIAVPDQDMGAWGGPTDLLYYFNITTGAQYLLFQETAPQLPDLGVIPLWSSQLRPWSTDPQVLPIAWPSVVVSPPEPE